MKALAHYSAWHFPRASEFTDDGVHCPLSNMTPQCFSYQETEVHQKHPEDYQVYEDGGSSEVRPGRAGAEASSSVWDRLLR